MGSQWRGLYKFSRWLRFPDCTGTGSRTPKSFTRSLKVQIARKTPKTSKTNALFGKLLNSTRKECEKGEAAIADVRRLHPDRQVADFHIFHFQIAETPVTTCHNMSQHVTTCHNMSQPFYTCRVSGVHFARDECAEVECRRSMTGGWSQHRWGLGPKASDILSGAPESRAQSFVCSQIWRVGNLEFKTWVEHIGTRIWMIMF